MSPGQTGHITGQMGRVPGTDGTHTRGCPAKLLYVYWFFSFLPPLVNLRMLLVKNLKATKTSVNTRNQRLTKGGSLLLTVGAFLLTVKLLCLQSLKALMRHTFPL